MIQKTVTFKNSSIQNFVLIYPVTIEELEAEFKNWIWGVKDEHDRLIDHVKDKYREEYVTRKHWDCQASDFFFVDALGKVRPRK